MFPASRQHRLALLAGLLLATGCDGLKDRAKAILGVEDGEYLDVQEPTPELEPVETPDAGSSESAPIERQPLERALNKFPFLAKGAPNLGFKLTALDELHALRAEVEVPKWSAQTSDDPAAVLDDDLDTAWNCVPADLQNCALGLHLAGPAKVKALRIFAAGGTANAANDAHPRPKKIRVHTAEGFAEANVPDSSGEIFVVLGRAAETPNISIEFLEFWNAKKDQLRVGEVEVYGPQGGARAPLHYDPRRTFVTWEGRAWNKKGDRYRPAMSFLRTLAPDRSVHTISTGSALRGAAGDRIMLIERLDDSSCTRTEGTVHLVDLQTRILAPLGELGGVGADLFRHMKGLGVALGYTDEYSTTLAGVTVEPGRGYMVKRTPIREDKRKKDTFAEWNLEALVVPRTGTPLAASTNGCDKPTPEQLEDLQTTRGTKLELEAGNWAACTVGNATAFLSDHGPCGDRWEVYLVGADGTLIDQATQKHPGSHLRLVRLDDASLLVEASGVDDSSQVLHLHTEGLSLLAENGALALPPPGGCRSECGDGFPNPHAPTW